MTARAACRRSLIGAAIAALLALGLRPLAAQSPAAAWRTLETPHFRVHYPLAAEEWTKRLAARLESAREAVAAEVGFTPAERVTVVVADPQATANASAWPLLGAPRIALWTTPPAAHSPLAQARDWGELAAVHEYAHLAHLLRPSRNPWRAFVGRSLLPLGPLVLKAPRWAVEGYATLVEGRVTARGRPHSALRAAVLRAWGRAGRLPSYGRLANAGDAFLGRSMAYLVGSAFLEWTERLAGDERALVRLWAAATARADRSFDDAWRRVFGRSPAEDYARFVAETSAAALAVERAQAPTAREGELWLELEGATGVPAVAPDGRRLAALVRERERPARLVVWELDASPAPADEPRDAAPVDREDPPAVATAPRRRPVARELEPPARVELTGARWLDDGSTLLVTALAPDRDGFRHGRLALWSADDGLDWIAGTRDLFDAEPLPGGTAAIAARWRDGRSSLVLARFADGVAVELVAPTVDAVHDQPRLAPDGRTIAWLEQRDGRWRARLATLDLAGERLAGLRDLDLAGGEPSHLAWHPAGRHLYLAVARDGTIDIEAVAVAADAESHRVTRSVDAAFAPAPAPDGRTLFHLGLDPDGFVLRRLALDAATTQPAAAGGGDDPRAASELEARPASVGEPRPYRLGDPGWTPVVAGWTSSGAGVLELGARAGDAVGRWQALALGAVGGERVRTGGGLRLDLVLEPAAIELAAAELTEDGRDARAIELSAVRRLRFGSGELRLEGGATASRFDDSRGDREVAFAALGLVREATAGLWRARLELDGERVEEVGGGDARWQRLRASAALGRRRRALAVVAAREQASAAAVADLVALGGAPSSLVPRRHEPGRHDHPALPRAALAGERLDQLTVRLRPGGGALTLFAERYDARLGAERRRLELAGAELGGSIGAEPLAGLPALDWRAGVARVRGADRDDETRFWLGLVLPWRTGAR